MTKLKILFALWIVLMLGACNTSERVAFGTHTIYGLDIDTEPTPTLSIGVDRGEVMVGPRYDNGAVPPVVASVKLKGGLFSTDVSQIYATGNAATLATKGEPIPNPKELKGGRKTMIFGTNTNLGLKVSFIGNAPKSFSFGFKRQELSVIPVGTNDKGVDTYGSVLAAIDTDTDVSLLDDSKFGYGAFFATGLAAESLAETPEIQGAFKKAAKERFFTSKYSDDSAGRKIEAFWMPGGELNTTNKAKLVAEMKKLGLDTGPGRIARLITAEEFASMRKKIVEKLKL
jgi:hypothetical protein